MSPIFITKLVAILGVLWILTYPLHSEGSGWGIQEGLLLLCAICLLYAIWSRRGIALNKNRKGYRIHPADLMLLGVLPLYLLYIGNERLLNSGDTLPASLLPHRILEKGTVDLTGAPGINVERLPYSIAKVDGQLLSRFPLGTGFLALPYVAIGKFVFARWPNDIGQVLKMEKHFAALVAIASALILFVGLRKSFPERIAALTSIVYALATTLFSTCSQAMWSFTGELFFITIAIALLIDPVESRWKPVLAGASMGVAFFCRPTAAVFIAVLFFLLAFENRKRAISYGIAAALVVVGAALLQYAIYGNLTGGYGSWILNSSWWHLDFSYAFAGNLISPSRGLLIYFPYLICAIYFAMKIREARIRRWMIASVVSIFLAVCLNSFFTKWWGGHSLGARTISESAPFLALLTIPVWTQWRSMRWQRLVFAVLLIFAILTQFQSVYDPAVAAWNSAVDVDKNPDVAWSWRNSQLAAAWIPGWEYSEQ